MTQPDLIAADIGNTTTALAAFSGRAMVGRAGIGTERLTGAGARTALAGLGAGPAVRAAIASVVPAATSVIAEALAGLGCQPAIRLDPLRHDIIANRLESLETVGVDRLLAARAALATCPPRPGEALLVIQAGSAVTIDKVDDKGVFQGGLILPGPGLWLQGLAGAARLPSLAAAETDWGSSQPGRNTRDAILRGLGLGLPGAIERAARAIGQGGCRAVLSGGWADTLRPRLGCEAELVPDLVLRGICLVIEKL